MNDTLQMLKAMAPFVPDDGFTPTEHALAARLKAEEESHAITAANLARLQDRWDKRPVVYDLQARLAEAERDAARYRWLRTRINWRDYEDSFAINRTSPPITYRSRYWTHVDVRGRQDRPASEHIDEYIDAQLGAADSADGAA